MNTDRFLPQDSDCWLWHLATEADVDDIVEMAEALFQSEIEDLFVPRPDIMAYSLRRGLVEQNYSLAREQIIVARDKHTQKLLAWAWCKRGIYLPYAVEEIAEAAFAHVDLTLPTRTRITILAQTIQQWLLWCQLHRIPVMISSSIRAEQASFMRLHQAFGFRVNGSLAYKRIAEPLQ
jgi:hypothetical protein